MKNILVAVLLLLSTTAYSQTGNGLVKFINPAAIAAPKGYSHAAVVNLGTCTMVIISGQVALDSTGKLIGPGEMAAQARQVFANIKHAVTAAGGKMDDIVKLGYYITDVTKIQAVRDVRDRFINTQHPPASTLVQVSKLFRDDVLLEIEATAIIPKK